MSRSRMIVVVFFVTGALVFTIHLRTSASKIFNQYRIARVEQERLRKELWQQKIRLDSLITPVRVVEQVNQLIPEE